MGYNHFITCALQEVPLMDKKKRNNKILYWALIAVFAVIFLISGSIVLDYVMESQEHENMMEDLRDLHSRPMDDFSSTYPTIRPSSKPAGSSSSTVAPPYSSITVPPTSVGGDVTPSQPTPSIPEPSESVPQESQPTDPEPTDPELQPTDPEPTDPPTSSVPTQPPHVNTTILAEMKAIYQLNNDVVGWIYIPGSRIDYPVLQAKDRPDYYLYRNIYGKEDRRGSIYAEEHCDVFNPSDVVVLHGHHMADGSMFHNVKYFMYDYYLEDNPYVYFDTLYTRRKYEVVLLFRCNGEPSNKYPFFPYHTYNDFKNEAEFNSFMSSIRKLAYISTDVEVKYGDKLLLMSTCYDYPYPNGRIVLVCKLIG